MSEQNGPINLELNAISGIEQANAFATALKTLLSSVQALNTTSSGALKQEFANLTTAATGLNEVLGVMVSGAGMSNKGGLKKALGEGLEEAVKTVRAHRQELQNEYQKLRELGNLKIGALENFKAQGVTLFPEDKARLAEYTTAKTFAAAQEKQALKDVSDAESAKAREQRDAHLNHVKNLAFENKTLNEQLRIIQSIRKEMESTGLTSAGVAELYGTKAQFWARKGNVDRLQGKASAETQGWVDDLFAKEQAKAEIKATEIIEGFRSKSASNIDVRTLLGLTPAALGKSAQGSAEVFKEAFAAEVSKIAARDKSASNIDVRTLLGLTPAALGKSAQGSAEVFKDAFAQEALKGRSASNIDVRTLLGLSSEAQQKSAKSSAEVFKEAFAAESAGLSALSPAYSSLRSEKDAAAAAAKRLTAEQKALTHGMHEAHSAARGLASGFGAMWLTWGSIVPLLAGAAVSHSIVQATKDYANLEHQLKFVEAIAQDTSVSLRDMMDSVGKAAVQFGLAPEKAAEGLVGLAQAGLSTTEALGALPTVIRVATLAQMSMKDSTETLTGAAYSFGTGLDSMGHIGDVFTKAAGVSNTSVASIAESMKQASTVAQMYGQSVEDVSLALVALAKRNITGSAAGTAYRNLMDELATPRGDAKKVASALKISLFDPATNDTKDFFGKFVPELRQKLAEFDPESRTFILNKLVNNRGSKALSAILGMSDEDLANLRGQIDKSTGLATKAAIDLQDSLKGDAGKLSAAFAESLGKGASNGVGSLRSALQTLRDVVESPAFVGAVAALTRAVYGMVNAFSAAAEFLTSPGGLVVGLAASAAGLYAIGPAAALAAEALGGVGLALAAIMRFTVIGAAVTTVALAFGFLWSKLSEKSAAEQALENTENLTKRTIEYNKQLDESIRKLREKRGLEGETLSDGELEGFESARARLNETVEKAQAIRDRYQATGQFGGKGGALSAVKPPELVDAEYAVQREAQAFEKLRVALQGRGVREAALRAAEEKSKKEAYAKAGLGEDGKPLKDGSLKHFTEIPDAGFSTKTGNLAQTVDKEFDMRLTALTRAFGNERKLMDSEHANRLTSDGVYYAKTQLLADRALEMELTLVASFAEKSAKAYADAKDKLLKENPTNETQRKALQGRFDELENSRKLAVEKFALKQSELQDTALTRIAEQANRASGKLEEVKQSYRDFVSGLAVRDAKKERDIATEDSLRGATPNRAAVIQAEAAERETLTQQVVAYNEVIRKSREELDRLFESRKDTASLTDLMAMEADYENLAKLNKEREKARDLVAATIAPRSKAAGEAVSDRQLKDREFNSSWLSTSRSALEAYEESALNVASSVQSTFSKAFSGMEDALTNFVMTGKISFGSLANSIISDMIRIAIRQSITAPLAGGLLGLLGGGLNPVKAVASVVSPVADFSFQDKFMSAPLPAFAVGTDYVPNDMIAQIHQGERIIPAAQNAAMQRNWENSSSEPQQVVNVTQNFTVGDIASMSEVRKAVAGAERRIASNFQRSRKYGGVAA